MSPLSGVQKYMLVVEGNKSAAQEIVQDAAQSESANIFVERCIELTDM